MEALGILNQTWLLARRNRHQSPMDLQQKRLLDLFGPPLGFNAMTDYHRKDW